MGIQGWLSRLQDAVCWSEDWLKHTVEAFDGERFWYPRA
jgi:hypothetical protein